MFSFFKKSPSTAVRRKSSSDSSWTNSMSPSRAPLTGPAPLPEVIEGNEASDWALWENSVSFMDSQMPPDSVPPPQVRVKDDPFPDTEWDLPDPFASVNSKRS